MRGAIAAYARRERAKGVGLGGIAAKVGVSKESIRRWVGAKTSSTPLLSVVVRCRRGDRDADRARRLPGRAPHPRAGGRAAAPAGMIGSTRTLRVWAYPEPADLRAKYDGLAALVTAQLGRDPLSGHLFLFQNRSRTRAKVLLWEAPARIYQSGSSSGLRVVARDGRGVIELTVSDFALFLRGCGRWTCRLPAASCRARSPCAPATWQPARPAPEVLHSNLWHAI
jgi:transposase